MKTMAVFVIVFSYSLLALGKSPTTVQPPSFSKQREDSISFLKKLLQKEHKTAEEESALQNHAQALLETLGELKRLLTEKKRLRMERIIDHTSYRHYLFGWTLPTSQADLVLEDEIDQLVNQFALLLKQISNEILMNSVENYNSDDITLNLEGLIAESKRRELISLKEEVETISQRLFQMEKRVDKIQDFSHVEIHERILNLSQINPKAIKYYEWIFKDLATRIQAYWILNTGKIATTTTKTDLAAQGIASGIRIIPGTDVIASAVQAGIVAGKGMERQKRFSNAFETFSDPENLMLIAKLLALDLSEGYQGAFVGMEEEQIRMLAKEASTTAIHSITSGLVIHEEFLQTQAMSPEKIAAFLANQVRSLYTEFGFPVKNKKKLIPKWIEKFKHTSLS